ncbi:hypothetical protein [Micromonospora sp. CPCC 206061]|uniref:hypothetical protein n=1 Tax=Micromonospora sp. CPCC 206061 TaxID=3122410 RepID=UPI002FF2E8B6
MRRLAVVLGGAASVLWFAAPASAFAHDKVANPYLHTVLDALVLAVVTAPVWTAYLWGGRRRALLMALVALVQVPVAVIAFVPIVDPIVHLVAFLIALGLTGASLTYVRRYAPSPAPAQESVRRL